MKTCINVAQFTDMLGNLLFNSKKTVHLFICTDNKHKISVGEPDTPFSALPRGKRVLVGAANHDYSLASIILTIILLNDGSWYSGRPLVGLKIAAIDPLTAIPNAKEIANALTTFYGS